MGRITLQPGEIVINTWTLFYMPPARAEVNGKLTVTSHRLIYRLLYNGEIVCAINKKDISYIHTQESFLAHKVIVMLADGTKHEFDRGVMGVSKLVKAINS